MEALEGGPIIINVTLRNRGKEYLVTAHLGHYLTPIGSGKGSDLDGDLPSTAEKML